jgi:GTPase
MSKQAEKTAHPKERAFLVGVELYNVPSHLTMEDSLAELAALAETAGLFVVGELFQRLSRPNPDTFVGSGKVEEIKALVHECHADLVIFDSDLSPRHQRQLEKSLEGIRVIDRAALILDIFAQRAQTREGILQVELAQYEYRLPRLTRAWTHLARQAGGGAGRTGGVGGVGLRGPGETQLEVDRREIHRRIGNLKQELEKVRSHRGQHRSQRKKAQFSIVSIVGYTNAGKSTLLNQLSDANVLVEDKLFATLDPTTRRVDLPGGHKALFTDTVGFIQKLPTQLVAAFRATLEEIAESDLLLHVVDITHANALAQWKSVQQTLDEIGAGHIPTITAFNKIDQLPSPESVPGDLASYPDSYAISAKTKMGLENLLDSIEESLFKNLTSIIVNIPYNKGDIISLFHDQARVDKVFHDQDGVTIHGQIPINLINTFSPYSSQTSIKPIEE